MHLHRKIWMVIMTMLLLLLPGSQVSAQSSPVSTEWYLNYAFRNIDSTWAKLDEALGVTDHSAPNFVAVPAEKSFSTGCNSSGTPIKVGDPEEDNSFLPYYFCPASGGELYDGSASQNSTMYISAPWIEHAFDGINPLSYEFAVAYLIAHMYGHYIQTDEGYFRKDSTETYTDRQLELSADCLAGIWANAWFDDIATFDPEDDDTILAIMISWDEVSDTITADDNFGDVKDRYRSFMIGYEGGANQIETCWPQAFTA